jgi:hypothetical protein
MNRNEHQHNGAPAAQGNGDRLAGSHASVDGAANILRSATGSPGVRAGRAARTCAKGAGGRKLIAASAFTLLVAGGLVVGFVPRWREQRLAASDRDELAVPTVSVVSPAPELAEIQARPACGDQAVEGSRHLRPGKRLPQGLAGRHRGACPGGAAAGPDRDTGPGSAAGAGQGPAGSLPGQTSTLRRPPTRGGGPSSRRPPCPSRTRPRRRQAARPPPLASTAERANMRAAAGAGFLPACHRTLRRHNHHACG